MKNDAGTEQKPIPPLWGGWDFTCSLFRDHCIRYKSNWFVFI